MPIDRDKALGASLGESQGCYEPDDVILYHLGVGAGFDATDPAELEYTFEKNLKVLPSFAVVAGSSFTSRARKTRSGGGGLFNVEGLEFNPAMLLHGEQEITLHRPLPTSASFTTKSRVADIFDKGKAALVVFENNSIDDAGEPLFSSRTSAFIRGEGGFGGPSGPKVGNVAPERAPDGVVERPTLAQQALLYRLNGDKNPLHADPEFAKMGGFDTPIIHGLCSYGIACKAIIDDALAGDVSQVASYAARFRGVGFPGETYLISYWKEGDTILLEAKSKERDAIIISNAAITLRS
ncbi:MAG: MaoC family dehydratase N-terminal domain-containing protein [Deltaproteobacteria bacterium]|nr:MaoC family dehydratase N-terminal domain-containing protein [Deltaproteobacteria bacterium]